MPYVIGAIEFSRLERHRWFSDAGPIELLENIRPAEFEKRIMLIFRVAIAAGQYSLFAGKTNF
jgi:hypothetical protein